MPIESFTGLPRNGKTTFMVEHLIKQAKLGERPLFAAGIDGLNPGLATILKDARDWNAVKPGEACTCHDTEDSAECTAHVIPNGSLIYVDEAWKWFGHLHDATRQATPRHVLALAEHGHRGLDFVWTYQQPNQIYPFARGLMAEHHHVVRRFGSKLVDVYTWAELNEDVKSAAKRENASKQSRILPKEAWDEYKSAEVHTVKMKIPWKLLAIPLGIVFAIGGSVYAYHALKPSTVAANIAGEGQSAVGSTAVGAPGDAEEKPKYATPLDYAKAHLPRFGTMPWTAPVYDDRSVTADPQLICMSSPGGLDSNDEYKGPTCTCITEQGTAYDISEPECRTVARRGPVYNPYRERRDQQQSPYGVQQQGPALTGRLAPAVAVLPQPNEGQLQTYGDLEAGVDGGHP